MTIPMPRPWQMVQVDSLTARAPKNHTLESAAVELLRNDGRWPHPKQLPRHVGDQQFTTKFATWAARPTPLRIENGVNK